MTSFTKDDDLSGATFTDTNLKGARFDGANLTDVVMRGMEISRTEIDSPWLFEGEGLVVNGVDVLAYVDAELDRRFPGRSEKTAQTPEALAVAHDKLDAAWLAAIDRAAAMPDGTVDVSVGGEWSFAESVRHIVLATDIWLGKAILGREDYHPLGRIGPFAADEGFDLSVFTDEHPTFDQVLEARASRVTMVRDFIASVTPEQLDEPRPNPWAPSHQESVRQCLHVILDEGWEHLRYAVRDLDAIEAGRA